MTDNDLCVCSSAHTHAHSRATASKPLRYSTEQGAHRQFQVTPRFSSEPPCQLRLPWKRHLLMTRVRSSSEPVLLGNLLHCLQPCPKPTSHTDSKRNLAHTDLLSNSQLFSVTVNHVVLSDSFAAPWTVACQAPLSMGFPRQEYWSRLPFLYPEDLPNSKVKPGSPALQADSLLPEPLGKTHSQLG